MSSITPGPKVWTVRFKAHRTTVLLYVEPTQRLSSIKSDLLSALRETHPDHHLQGRDRLYQIPGSIHGVQLAKLVEHEGDIVTWSRIDSDDADNAVTLVKGKGKASNEPVNGYESKETAQNSGLSDGSTVAVRFVGYPGADSFDGDDDNWDVVFPSQETDEMAIDGNT